MNAGNSLLAGALLLLISAPSGAQEVPAPTRDSLLSVVQVFFSAMEARDTARLHGAVRIDGHTLAVVARGDTVNTQVRPLKEFLANLPATPQRWRERIWEPQVLMHGNLAVVWAPYDFYLDSSFSHCGVDTFTLSRGMDGWKIVDVGFTIERQGCPPSPLGPRKD
ncbi:MAG: nuclear transport factor 2 family protein [Gemmatimonadota bacterium]